MLFTFGSFPVHRCGIYITLLCRQEMPQREDNRTEFVPQIRIMKRDPSAGNQALSAGRTRMSANELAQLVRTLVMTALQPWELCTCYSGSALLHVAAG